MTTDNDSAGITYSANNATLMEGGSGTPYTVVLDTQPSDNVEIEITLPSDSPDNLELSSGTQAADMPNELITLTFTDTDWNSAQMVTLTLVEDSIASGNANVTIMHSSSSSDSDYNSIPAHDLMVTIQDNEMPTVTIPATLSIDEGNSGDIMVSISHEPVQNVEITLTEDSDEASISPGILTFTPGADAEDDFTPNMTGENYDAGTEDDPNIICNANQLQSMKDDLSAHYELGKDIDASSISTNTCPTSTMIGTCTGFQPIGNCGVDGICRDDAFTSNDESIE